MQRPHAAASCGAVRRAGGRHAALRAAQPIDAVAARRESSIAQHTRRSTRARGSSFVPRARRPRERPCAVLQAGSQLQRDWLLLPNDVASSIVQADSVAAEKETLWDVMQAWRSIAQHR